MQVDLSRDQIRLLLGAVKAMRETALTTHYATEKPFAAIPSPVQSVLGATAEIEHILSQALTA